MNNNIIKNISLSIMAGCILSTTAIAGFFSSDPVTTVEGISRVKIEFDRLVEVESKYQPKSDLSCDQLNDFLDDAYESVGSTKSATDAWGSRELHALVDDDRVSYQYISAYNDLFYDVYGMNWGRNIICFGVDSNTVMGNFKRIQHSKSAPLIKARSSVIKSKLKVFSTIYPAYKCDVVTEDEFVRTNAKEGRSIKSDLTVGDVEFNDNLTREIGYCVSGAKADIAEKQAAEDKARQKADRLKASNNRRANAEKSWKLLNATRLDEFDELLRTEKGATDNQIRQFNEAYMSTVLTVSQGFREGAGLYWEVKASCFGMFSDNLTTEYIIKYLKR